MKVKTIIQNYGKTVNANGQEYNFDRAGYCDIDDNEAKVLIEKYPKLFFDEASKKEERKLTVVEEYTAEAVRKLEENNLFLKEQIQDQKRVIASREDEIAVWKEKVEELMKGDGKETSGLKEENESLKKQVGLLEFKCDLVGSTIGELKQLCEESKHEKSQWATLSKEELIKFLMVKAEEALSKEK